MRTVEETLFQELVQYLVDNGSSLGQLHYSEDGWFYETNEQESYALPEKYYSVAE